MSNLVGELPAPGHFVLVPLDSLDADQQQLAWSGWLQNGARSSVVRQAGRLLWYGYLSFSAISTAMYVVWFSLVGLGWSDSSNAKARSCGLLASG